MKFTSAVEGLLEVELDVFLGEFDPLGILTGDEQLDISSSFAIFAKRFLRVPFNLQT